jgi:hypothetical protein
MSRCDVAEQAHSVFLHLEHHYRQPQTARQLDGHALLGFDVIGYLANRQSFALANANDERCTAPQTIGRRISPRRPLLYSSGWRIIADMTWSHAMHDSRILLLRIG